MMRCRFGLFLLSLSSLLGSAALTGCGFTTAPVSSTVSLQMSGSVMGGQQPVSGAIVSLYVAGTGGNGTAATNLMGTGTGSKLTYTTTNGSGQFSITGDYTCPLATSSYTPQTYLVASYGNPGLGGNVSNQAIVMVDALGPCGNLGSYKQITVNEVTTVAAAWALAGFATSATNIAASATNATGLANAFLDAQLIADPALGTAPGSTFPAANTIETGKIYALADIIATCVNSDGTTPCQTLYKTSGLCASACTSDTFSAALYIAKHPGGSNVGPLFGLIPTNQPYATSLTTAPNEWTLSMSMTGGGLSSPTEMAIDTAGNAWVADYNGAVSTFSPQGTALSPSNGFGAGVLGSELYGLAIDGSSNVWVDIEEHPSSVSGLYGITSGQTLGSVISINGANYVSGNYIYFPESLATGQDGSIIIGNYGDSTATSFKYTPASGFVYLLTNAGTPYSAEPTDESGDANGGVWLADNGGRSITHIDKNGYLISHPSCCLAANGIATDKFGNAWVANYYSNTVSEILPGCDANASPNAACYGNQQNVVVFGADSTCNTSSASANSCGQTGGGLYSPSKVAVDGAQNVWVVNYHGASVTELAGNGGTLAAGTPISPSSTYDGSGNVLVQGGYGLDAKLLDPFDVAPDASGNLWVTSKDTSTLVLFFGLAAPTATPKLPVAATP